MQYKEHDMGKEEGITINSANEEENFKWTRQRQIKTDHVNYLHFSNIQIECRLCTLTYQKKTVLNYLNTPSISI